MDDSTYTPEEFAQKMKLRGIVRSIADARDYVKRSGKKEFTEDDFAEQDVHGVRADTG